MCSTELAMLQMSVLHRVLQSTASTLNARALTTPVQRVCCVLIVVLIVILHVIDGYDYSLQFPGTAASLTGTSLNINGNLTVNGTTLQLHLDNASVAVSGDLRIKAGVPF